MSSLVTDLSSSTAQEIVNWVTTETGAFTIISDTTEGEGKRGSGGEEMGKEGTV